MEFYIVQVFDIEWFLSCLMIVFFVGFHNYSIICSTDDLLV